MIRTLSASILSCFLLSQVAHAEEPIETAKGHFATGVKLYKNEDYDAALVEFKAAYEAKPHFAVRYNIGITLYKLHRYKEAFLELESYMYQGGDEILDERRDEVVEILKELESLLGTLKVKCDVTEAVLVVDGWAAESWDFRLEVGEHTVEVTADGYEPFKQLVELPAGSEVVIEVDLVPEEKATAVKTKGAEPGGGGGKKVPAAAFWSVMGLTLALGASAAVTGGLTVKQRKDYSKLTYDDPDWESERERGRTLALTTDILLATAGAAAVTTIILAFLTDFEGSEKRDVSLLILPTGGSLTLGLGGVF